MPRKKNGGKTRSGEPAVVVQALNQSERRILQEAQEVQDRNQAREGSEPYWIASQIWSPADAFNRLNELAGYDLKHRNAQHSAIVLRVFTLACQMWDPLRSGATAANRIEGLHAYSAVFHRMGSLTLPRQIFDGAVWIKREYSGLQVELENMNEEGDTHDHTLYHTLNNQEDALGCRGLLKWIGSALLAEKDRVGITKFADYTNLLMRTDAGLPPRPTSSDKLRLHKGDFASYITGKRAKDILIPISTQTFSLSGLTPENSPEYAVDQKYEVRDCHIYGQGYFNGNHGYDQLNHQLIESAMKSYSAGSSVFWASFVLASLVDVPFDHSTPNSATDAIRKRVEKWRELSKRLPIPEYMLSTAYVLACHFTMGYLKVHFERTSKSTVSSGAVVLLQLDYLHAKPGEVMHTEPDEDTLNSSTRPSIVNRTTPTAFARAEHREPMWNHFYS